MSRTRSGTARTRGSVGTRNPAAAPGRSIASSARSQSARARRRLAPRLGWVLFEKRSRGSKRLEAVVVALLRDAAVAEFEEHREMRPELRAVLELAAPFGLDRGGVAAGDHVRDLVVLLAQHRAPLLDALEQGVQIAGLSVRVQPIRQFDL